MAEITAALVKQLRDKTGAGMMDAKKALVENNGDLDASADWLREKGILKAAKKADRIAAEGLVGVAASGNAAAEAMHFTETEEGRAFDVGELLSVDGENRSAFGAQKASGAGRGRDQHARALVHFGLSGHSDVVATGAGGLEVTSLSSWQALAVGGVSAGLSAVMGLITAGFGDRSTASMVRAVDGADH